MIFYYIVWPSLYFFCTQRGGSIIQGTWLLQRMRGAWSKSISPKTTGKETATIAEVSSHLIAGTSIFVLWRLKYVLLRRIIYKDHLICNILFFQNFFFCLFNYLFHCLTIYAIKIRPQNLELNLNAQGLDFVFG